jgi:hypothetical protein
LSDNGIYLPVIVGMIAGIALIAVFSMFTQVYKFNKFDAAAMREGAYLVTTPLSTEKNFNCNKWLDEWAGENNARIVYINGYKAAIHAQRLGLRGDEVRADRAELAMCTEDYEYYSYGFVSEQALVKSVENAFEYQKR